MQDLICISHLRWNFVWQRPQHLLSRLAQYYRVLFVEEPVTNTEIEQPQLDTFAGHGQHPITILRLFYPAQQHFWIGHNDPRTQQSYAMLLNNYLQQQGYQQPLLWLYTPMAASFIQTIRPQVVIYDVMDELATFKGAPVELKMQERMLLEEADVIFTGGVSLYRARQALAKNIHLFPSGVETSHFAQADSNRPHARPTLSLPSELANLSGPILGYFGVIDERMDLNLLAGLAQRHPNWQIVLIGPVIKIEPETLPQAPNLHYLGMKSYQELPNYLARFDVALVPFLMNESTRFLSPTKTLEYLAAHKPVVATPIPDIVELYGDYVRIGATLAEFASQVEAALNESAEQRASQRERVDSLLASNSWDAITNRMHEILQKQVASAQPGVSKQRKKPTSKATSGKSVSPVAWPEPAAATGA